MQTTIHFQQAKEILQSQNLSPLGTERVFLHNALGRILADDILAPSNMPTFPLSNMDGYAFSSAFQTAKSFKILGENPAGNPQQTLPLSEPFAIKTFTGARIPHNADMLAPIESCEVCEEFVTINILPKQWLLLRLSLDGKT